MPKYSEEAMIDAWISGFAYSTVVHNGEINRNWVNNNRDIRTLAAEMLLLSKKAKSDAPLETLELTQQPNYCPRRNDVCIPLCKWYDEGDCAIKSIALALHLQAEWMAQLQQTLREGVQVYGQLQNLSTR